MPSHQDVAKAPRTATPRRGLAKLPAFALYGEAKPPDSVLLHIESIHARSRLYDWEIDAHVHQGLHQVLWLRQGRVEAILDESRTTSDGPVALAIPPGVAHAFRFSKSSDGFVLTFKASLLAESGHGEAGDALQTLFASPRCLPLVADSPDVQRLQNLVEALHAESLSAEDASSPVPRWLTLALVWSLARLAQRHDNFTGQPRAAGRQPLYTRWVVLLEAHYRDHWPVSRYAQRLGLSTERLNRMVQAETGQSAQALLHARLAREACRHLLHLAAPVSKIAFELGFEDPAYFCRFFKRHAGCSPRAYRNQSQSAAAGSTASSPPGSMRSLVRG